MEPDRKKVEEIAEDRKQGTVNNYIQENNDLISKIRYLAKEIENKIFCLNDNESENPEPTCLIAALEIQNYNLKDIVYILEKINNTLTAN